MSKDGYFGDFESRADELQAFQEYNDRIELEKQMEYELYQKYYFTKN